MIKNNESFDNLINYFDSEQYKQLLKGFISVSETAESLLDKFSFNILDSMTSALINISKSFEQRQSKILFDSLEILKNVPLDSLDWNSSSNREVQLDDKSVERVSDVLDTVIPDDVPKKKSLEETLKSTKPQPHLFLACLCYCWKYIPYFLLPLTISPKTFTK